MEEQSSWLMSYDMWHRSSLIIDRHLPSVDRTEVTAYGGVLWWGNGNT